MSLPPGTWIGVYEVVDLVGVGGMGEVYRARDSRLDRAVAIKTLPDEFAKDAERLARFEREAKVLAQLNHPHIAGIYGLETGAAPALVMEMVEGDTLADRLQLGPIPLDETMAIAHQVADALEHAHAQGIVHRDLKPANVKVGARGAAPKVKVLDFGLAKAMMSDPNASSISAVSSPTITSPMNLTRAGLIMGTAAYMSPEQARGRNVDQRADIWAFGCIVYEMLTGARAFEGAEIADVLARVIQSEPDWTLLPPSTPAAIKTVLQRCLRKDPAKRIHSIADARLDLDESSLMPAAATTATPVRAGALAALGGFAIGAIVAGLAVYVSLASARVPVSEPRPIKFSLMIPEGWTTASAGGNNRLEFAVSPDGEQLAVILAGKAGRKIFVHRFDEQEFRELPGTEDARSLAWSADNKRIGFSTGAGIRRIELNGGGSQQVSSDVAGNVGLSWSAADQIIFSTGAGRPLRAIPAAGGSARDLAPLRNGVIGLSRASWLPDGSGYMAVEGHGAGLFNLIAHRDSGGDVELASFESTGNGGNATVSALIRSNHLLLNRSEPNGRSILTAQPIDVPALKLTGEAEVLLTDLNPAVSASENGILVYGPNGLGKERFHLFDLHGTDTPLPSPNRTILNFDWSPDERYIALQESGGGISLYDVARGVTTALIPRGSDPQWSADGKQIFYAQAPRDSGIYSIPAFGGQPELRYKTQVPLYTEDISADGKWMALVGVASTSGTLVPLAGGAPTTLENAPVGTSIDEIQFSPDAKWVAYSLIAASPEVYLAPMPPTGARWQVSVGGGADPRWRGDGKALYYLGPDGSVKMVEINSAAAEPKINPPRELFKTGVIVAPMLDQLAVNRDGTRFIIRVPEQVNDEVSRTLHVIVNWPSLLKKRP